MIKEETKMIKDYGDKRKMLITLEYEGDERDIIEELKTILDSITYKPKGQRCLCCAVFKLNDDRTLDVYYTMDDWFIRKPNVTFENVIEVEGICNGKTIL